MKKSNFLNVFPNLAVTSFVLAAAVFFIAPRSALAQKWPEKTITLIVPYGSGGSADILARHFGQVLSKELGQGVVIENRPGATGTIGATAVARAKPDGYTLLFTSTAPISTNQHILKSLPYNPQKDFEPVALFGTISLIVASKKGEKFSDFKSVVAAAKANPGKISIATLGNGALGHLAWLMIERDLGISLNHAFYNSSSQAINDLLGGHVELAIDTSGAYVAFEKAGKLDILAHTSSKPVPALPAVPSVATAANLPGFEAFGWYGLFAPAGMPPAVLERIGKVANDHIKAEATRTFYESIGVDPAGGPVDEFRTFLAKESDKIRAIVDGAGLRQR